MNSKSNIRILLLLLPVIYLFFVVPQIGRPLVADDANFSADADNPQLGVMGVWHPPFYQDIQRGLVRNFGIGRQNLRYFGVLCFLINLALIYLISQQISGQPTAAFWSCLLFATHPWAIQGSLILDIDNTILTVLLNLFIFYFIKNHWWANLWNYIFLGLLFFVCLWAKLSTPLILFASVILFYLLKGDFKKAFSWGLRVGAIGGGLFIISWLLYSRLFDLEFLSVFGRSLMVLKKGTAGVSLSPFSELVLRFIRVSLWIGIYLMLLWSIMIIKRIKEYFSKQSGLEIKDLLFIYTSSVFIAYIMVGGTSFGFAKHQYPLLPILCILSADYICRLNPRISRKQIAVLAVLSFLFIAVERLYIGNLLYQINYLLKGLSVFYPAALKDFFIDFSLRVVAYFLIFSLGVLIFRLFGRKEEYAKLGPVFLVILIILVNFSYDFRHLKSDYFTTYCYGRKISDYKALEEVLQDAAKRGPDALIIGPEDVLYNAGLKLNAGVRGEPRYNYSFLWNDREGFLNAIDDKRVMAVSYGFAWNSLLTYREIFFRSEVKTALEKEYRPFLVGEYSVWLRK